MVKLSTGFMSSSAGLAAPRETAHRPGLLGMFGPCAARPTGKHPIHLGLQHDVILPTRESPALT